MRGFGHRSGTPSRGRQPTRSEPMPIPPDLRDPFPRPLSRLRSEPIPLPLKTPPSAAPRGAPVRGMADGGPVWKAPSSETMRGRARGKDGSK
jgi:hypothetical protein